MKEHRFFGGFSAFAFFFLGCGFAANQFLVSNIRLSFGATETEMGYMVSALYVGSMSMVLLFGELAERIGKRTAGAIAALLICLGAVTLASASSVTAVIIGFAFYGAGSGSFESSLVALLADKHQANTNRVINLLQALFSSGAVLSPLILSALLPADRFRPSYIVAASVFGAICAYLLIDRSIDEFAVKSVTHGGLTIFRLLKNPLLLRYMAAMILYVGTESALTYWISTYFDEQGFSAYGAAALSCFWLAGIVGRLFGSRFRSAAVLAVPCFLAAGAGAALLLVVPGAVLKIGMVALCGLAYGPLYGGLQILGGSLFPKNTAAAFSLMVFAGGFGGTFFQPVISSIARRGSIGAVYIVVACICVFVAALMYFTNRKAARQAAGSSK